MSTPPVPADPFHVFRFRVTFTQTSIGAEPDEDAAGAGASDAWLAEEICEGAFSEVTGLEANVEPFAINEGGRAWGSHQRIARVSFGTVVLKRGMTRDRRLWQWFRQFTGGKFAARMHVYVTLQTTDGDGGAEDRLSWKLVNALPVKLKLADLNATGAEVGIEELHLVHEGITEVVEDG